METKEPQTSPGISSIHDFEKAYKEAIFNHEEAIEVPSKFFDTLCAQYLGGVKGQDMFTYGKPGIKVYREGKRDDIEAEGHLDVDEWTKQKLNKGKKR